MDNCKCGTVQWLRRHCICSISVIKLHWVAAEGNWYINAAMQRNSSMNEPLLTYGKRALQNPVPLILRTVCQDPIFSQALPSNTLWFIKITLMHTSIWSWSCLSSRPSGRGGRIFSFQQITGGGVACCLVLTEGQGRLSSFQLITGRGRGLCIIIIINLYKLISLSHIFHL